MTSELLNILCATMSIRQLCTRGYLETAALQACLDSQLRHNDTLLELDNALFDSPMTFLEDCNHICSKVAEAEASFFNFHLPRTSKRIQTAMERDHRSASLASFGDWEQPSLVEIHRVRRALWRLWLYFEIPNLTRTSKNEASNEDRLDRTLAFFEKLTVWQLEELECVHHHLKYQTQLWRKSCQHCHFSFLPDEILEHMRVCNQAKNGKRSRRDFNYTRG